MNKKLYIKKVIIFLLTIFFIISLSSNYVSAEINAEKLSEVLSKLSGENVTISNTGSTSTNTGSTNTGTIVSTGSLSKDTQPPKETINPINLSENSKQNVSSNTNVNKDNSNQNPSIENKSEEPLNSAPTQTDTIKSTFEIIKIENGDKKVTITFKVLNETLDIRKFEITYINYNGERNKSLTYEKEKIKNSEGNYVWYIPNLELTKYTISISGVNADGEKISGLTSKSFVADLSLGAAGKCIIPNVSGLKVFSKKDGSILYWNKIKEAVSYKVYMKNTNGVFSFIKDTKDNFYNINLPKSSVKYEEFSVKAVCSDGTESAKFEVSTKVRTGPSEIILGIISLIIGYFIVSKRKLIPGK